jgi:hypothetical protein
MKYELKLVEMNIGKYLSYDVLDKIFVNRTKIVMENNIVLFILCKLVLNFYSRNMQIFSVECQRANIIGFVGYMASVMLLDSAVVE